jgi:hypothetical protein
MARHLDFARSRAEADGHPSSEGIDPTRQYGGES